MADQVILSKLRLSVWDRKQQRSEPILDGRHDEVADFLDTSSATLGDYLKGLSIQLSGLPGMRKPSSQSSKPTAGKIRSG